VQRNTSPPSAPLAFFTFMMLLAPITNWEPPGVTLAGCFNAMGHGKKVQIVTPFRVSHLQRYGVTLRGNVTVCTHINTDMFVQGLEWDVITHEVIKIDSRTAVTICNKYAYLSNRLFAL
jgi:hypothetical protein